jgi:hypothetical protein
MIGQYLTQTKIKIKILEIVKNYKMRKKWKLIHQKVRQITSIKQTIILLNKSEHSNSKEM